MDVEIGCSIIERLNFDLNNFLENYLFHVIDTYIPDLGNMFQNCRKNYLDHHFEPAKAP
jgi:hypothetical protein